MSLRTDRSAEAWTRWHNNVQAWVEQSRINITTIEVWLGCTGNMFLRFGLSQILSIMTQNLRPSQATFFLRFSRQTLLCGASQLQHHGIFTGQQSLSNLDHVGGGTSPDGSEIQTTEVKLHGIGNIPSL